MHYIDCFFDIAFQCVTIIIHCQYLGRDLCRCGVDQKELNKWISCNTGEQVFVLYIGSCDGSACYQSMIGRNTKSCHISDPVQTIAVNTGKTSSAMYFNLTIKLCKKQDKI